MKSGWGLVLLGQLKRSAPVPLRAAADDGEPGRRVCGPLPDSSLCVHHEFRGTGCAAVPVAVFSIQAGGRRRWQNRAVPAIPQGRGPGRSEPAGTGEGVGEGDAAAAGSRGRLCLLGARRRRGSQRCARLRRAAECVRLRRLRERLGAGARRSSSSPARGTG